MAVSLFGAVLSGRFARVRAQLSVRGVCACRARDTCGRNVLMACLHVEDDARRRTVFGYLLRQGADPRHVHGGTGRDVLTWAVCMGRHEQVRQLLDFTACDLDLQRQDNGGCTALHHAVLGGHVAVTRMLVSAMRHYQLPVDVYDCQGMTPYIYARRLGHDAISAILADQGRASPRQADKHSFRGADEWETAGVQERRRKSRERLAQEQIRRKISGRLLPSTSLRTDAGDTYKKQAGQLRNAGMSRNVATSCDDSPHASGVKYVYGRSGDSHKHSLDEPDFPFSPHHHAGTGQRQRRRESKFTLNLMEDAAILAGTALEMPRVDEFKSSEFDVSKHNEYRAIDVSQLMSSLSEQQSLSFRKPVSSLPIIPRCTVVVEAPKKEKVSTLAILMGKGQQKAPRKRRLTGAKRGKKIDEKKKSRSMLPPIRTS